MTGAMNSSRDEEFLLKWNNHQSNLVSVFKDWLRDESFVDVTLVCGGEIVSGHKVVLAACSPLLNKILHNNPCRHPIVILNDVRFADMKALLKFIYQGEVSVSQSELASFLRTADNLQIKGLAEDKDKEERKRKDKDIDISARKRQRTDHENHVSPQPSQTVHSLTVRNEDSVVTSSPKPRKQSNSKEKYMPIHYQQSGGNTVFTNSVSDQNVSLTDDGCYHSEEFENDYHQHSLQNENKESICVALVKSEPYDCVGWQEDSVTSERGESDLAQTTANISADYYGNNTVQQTHIPVAILAEPVVDGTEILADETNQKPSEGDDNSIIDRADDDNEASHSTSDEQQSNTLVAVGQDNVGYFEDELPVENETFVKDPRQKQSSSHLWPVLPSSSSLISLLDRNPNTVNNCAINSVDNSTSYKGTVYTCKNCNFQSRNPYTYNRHLRIHSGTKEFKCSSCSYASSRKDSLVRHFRYKHIYNYLRFKLDATDKPSSP